MLYRWGEGGGGGRELGAEKVLIELDKKRYEGNEKEGWSRGKKLYNRIRYNIGQAR